MSKFVSRKLAVAVLTIILLVLNKQYTEALGVAIAYLGVQGAIDHKSTATKEPVPAPLPEEVPTELPSA